MTFNFRDMNNNWLTISEVGSELSFGTGDFTMLFRLYPNTIAYGAVQQGTVYSRNFTALEVYLYEGSLAAYVGGTSNPPGNIAMTISTWANCGLRRSGTSLRLWKDGSFGTASTNSANASGSGSIWFGSRQGNGGNDQSLAANLQDFGLWSVALSDVEMDSFNRGFPCKRIRPQSLVCDLRMIRNQQDARYTRTFANGSDGPSADLPTTHARVYG